MDRKIIKHASRFFLVQSKERSRNVGHGKRLTEYPTYRYVPKYLLILYLLHYAYYYAETVIKYTR